LDTAMKINLNDKNKYETITISHNTIKYICILNGISQMKL